METALIVGSPGALVVFFGFSGGGFFPTSHAIVGAGLLLFLLCRATLAEHPFEGFSPWTIAAALLLAGFTVWTLLSGSWGADHRAQLEYHRALMYLAALVAYGGLPRTPARIVWTVRLLLAGIVVVCAAGLVTRVLPELWPIDPGIAEDRLSYPITYWNALGVLGAIGVVLALHVTSSLREPPWARVAAAAVLPVLVTAIYLTFSRGGIAAGLAGIVVFVLVARPGALVTAAVAVLPACVGAIAVAAGADAIASANPAGPAAVAEGKDIALAVGFAIVFAIAVRALGLLADSRLTARAERIGPWPRRKLALGYGAGAATALIIALAAGAPGFVERQYDRFVEGDQTSDADLRQRLFDPGNNGRIDEWRVALDAFAEDRLRGNGAGTYQNLWAQHRPIYLDVVDAHSLYVEVLGELGLVGLVLLLGAIAALFAGLISRLRAPDRGPPAAVLAATVVWVLHAGVDWDWEMPVVTFWVFAVGAGVLAREPGRGRWLIPSRSVRVGVGLACLVLALTPIAVWRSQEALDEAVQLVRADRCNDAIDRALASASALGNRPEPFEVIGYCDVRLGYADLAEQAMRKAVERDPANWEFHYGLALVRGTFGRDPRPAAKRAFELNPKDELAIAVEERLVGDDPRVWVERARQLPLPGY